MFYFPYKKRDSISEGPDFYLKYYENIWILGGFNATPSNPCLILYLENQKLKSIIKNSTCFKSSNGSAADLILTNRSYLKKVSLLKQGLLITTI